MSKAIRIHETGGPEKLIWEDVKVGAPGPGEVLLRHTAIGLNFIDTYHRSGLYPLPELPAVLGREAAGVIEALGEGVDTLAVGDRVAYPMNAGSYAETRTIGARDVLRLPEAVDDRTAAAVMLKGLTVEYLLRRTYPVAAGETILLHAAAGGVGLLACRWAKHLGATVIGTVGSAEKAELARAHGCDHTILYREEDVAERVKELTGGRGVPVVYDSVGRDTFEMSLNCLQPRGLMVSFGNASGAVEPFGIGQLAAKGSLFLTRPSLVHYIAQREELEQASSELLRLLETGVLTVEIGQTYALCDAEQAHRDLEGRRTRGSTVLLP
ncbi:MAG: quinone oxidoreductase [bacterium]|nr:quinone oxidoreductase [bacterium]